jgi:hypothetical protein
MSAADWNNLIGGLFIIAFMVVIVFGAVKDLGWFPGEPGDKKQ